MKEQPPTTGGPSLLPIAPLAHSSLPIWSNVGIPQVEWMTAFAMGLSFIGVLASIEVYLLRHNVEMIWVYT